MAIIITKILKNYISILNKIFEIVFYGYYLIINHYKLDFYIEKGKYLK